MVTTQSGIGSGNLQPKPQVIEHAPEVTAAPVPITMARVHAMVWIMLDQQMQETRRLLQQTKNKLTVPVRQAPTLGATIWVEVGKKRKFEGTSRSNKNNMFSQSGGGRGEAKWCYKYGREHNGGCHKEVTCFKCGNTGHYAPKCSTKEEVFLKCSGKGHFKRDCLVRATMPNVPLKHYEGCNEEVTCYRCGRIGHHCMDCTHRDKVCYRCRHTRHMSTDCLKKNEATRPNVPPKPKERAFLRILGEATKKSRFQE